MTSGFFFGTTRYVRFSRLKLPTNSRTFTRPKLLADIFPYLRDCGCGEGDHGSGGKKFPEPGEFPGLGPEVVAPFRDAVRLVDCDEPDRGGGKGVKETGLHAFLR